MKKHILLVWIAALFALPAIAATEPPSTDSGTFASDYQSSVQKLKAKHLARELAAMAEIDQYQRHVLTEVSRNTDLSASERERLESKIFSDMAKADAAHTTRLKQILQVWSWPEIAASGANAAQDAYYLVQHSGDTALMKEALPHFEAFAKARLIGARQFAQMFDRLAMREKRPQRYGTQLRCLDGKWVLHDIEEPELVDALRADLGIDPFAETLKRIEALDETGC
ncbi:MAG: hypothetical protein JJ850_03440 [Kordiimonadaceae bacterium]|nr:hypothetical protein [Kordiimonadaceae bacterium]MBO6567141.1 hypothetical protein [Kordiimonadaceae bacterium]MBO6963644.1 hypothetical protein [Kordiimonadaceae bacterium]